MTEWREERDRAVAARAAALTRQKAAESEQAQQLIAAFIADATAAGIAPAPLSCLSYDGRTRYRTGLRGWYLNQARTVAIDQDGGYYVLTVPQSLRARFAGANPLPQPPGLIVSEGARDGESAPLRDLLRKRLSTG